MATQSCISLKLVMPRVTLQLADMRCPNRDSPPNTVPEHKCPDCGDKMRIVSFVEREQKDVIEKILRHCELWIERQQRGPPSRELELIEGIISDYSVLTGVIF